MLIVVLNSVYLLLLFVKEDLSQATVGHINEFYSINAVAQKYIRNHYGSILHSWCERNVRKNKNLLSPYSRKLRLPLPVKQSNERNWHKGKAVWKEMIWMSLACWKHLAHATSGAESLCWVWCAATQRLWSWVRSTTVIISFWKKVCFQLTKSLLTPLLKEDPLRHLILWLTLFPLIGYN